MVVGSYTHPAYAESMAATFELLGMTALLSRGLEGESVADPRRTAQVDGFVNGRRIALQAQEPGTQAEVPGLPKEIDIETTADYTRRVLAGERAGARPRSRSRSATSCNWPNTRSTR